MLRRLLSLPVDLALAPAGAVRRVATGLDDLAALAERARSQPDAIDEVRRRVDLALAELGELVGLLRLIHEDALRLDAIARSVRDVGVAIHDGGEDLLDASRQLHADARDLHDGGEDLLDATRQVHADMRELLTDGRDLIAVSRDLDETLGVFRAALPRLLAGLDTVEQLEGAVETVAETVEPLQGAAERVGRVTRRMSRR